MDIQYEIKGEQIKSLNRLVQNVHVIIQLDQMWNVIVWKFTHIYLDIKIELPVIEQEGTKMIQIQFTRTYEVKDIMEKKVEILFGYEGNVDVTARASGKATLGGYRVSVPTR